MLASQGIPGLVARNVGSWIPSALSHAELIARRASSAAASSSKPSETQARPSSSSLTPEQQKAADQAVQTAKATAGKAARIAALAALAGHYRDIHVSMEAVYTSQPGWTSKESAGHPLLSQGSFPAKPEPPKDMSLCSPAFPVSDVTQLPDNHPSVPQGDDVQLNPRYMDKLTCWLQTQPSHLESSVQLQTGINLFPPQDATYPTYIDFQAAMRLLDQHKSKQRMGKLRSLRRFQDKYQIKTWGHRPGEV